MQNLINNLIALRAAGQSRGEALVTFYECHKDAHRLHEHLGGRGILNVEADLDGLVWIYGEDSPEGREAKVQLAVLAEQQAARDAAAKVTQAKADQIAKQLKEVRDLPETPPPPTVVALW